MKQVPSSSGTLLALQRSVKRRARRRWSLEQHGIRREGSKEKGFSYVRPDGSPIADERELERIRSIRIPPAWTGVRIARGSGAELQAIGVDKAGRTQYLYHPKFRQRREQEKFLKVVHFGEALPRLRSRVLHDLAEEGLSRDVVLAAIVRILDQGFLRIGNKRSARERETFGLTTIRREHVTVSNDVVRFRFKGKWNKEQSRAIEDEAVARIVRRLKARSGKSPELFRYQENGREVRITNRQVNEYIQRAIGEEFSAKDFRTWGGTLVCSMALAVLGQAETKTERKRRAKKAVDSTAEILGNTPTVSRASYICPRLLEDYTDGHPVDALHPPRKRGNPIAKRGLSPEEKGLLKFFRETIADRRRKPRQTNAA